MSTLTVETNNGRFWADQRSDGFFLHIPNVPVYDMTEVCESLSDTSKEIEYRVLDAIVSSGRARSASNYMKAPFIGSAALSR